MGLLLDDAALRKAFREDPRGTAQRVGIELSDLDLNALQAVDWSAAGERLGRRGSKGGGMKCGANCN